MSSRPSFGRQLHTASRWGTIRYAIDSNARTARLCLILLAASIAPSLQPGSASPAPRSGRLGPARRWPALRGDLLSLLRPWARLASRRPYGRVIGALVTEARTDPVFAAQYRERFIEPRRDQARAAFRRAIERGEIPATTKIEVALDLLYGAIYHRLLHGHAPLSDRFVRDVIDTVADGITPRTPGQLQPAQEPAAPRTGQRSPL